MRQALYLAAFVIYRRHDYFHRIYRKHRRLGKQHENALVIVARRLGPRDLADAHRRTWVHQCPPKKLRPSRNNVREEKQPALQAR